MKVGMVIDGIRSDEGMLGGGFNYYTQLCEHLLQSNLDIFLFSYPSAFRVLPDHQRFFGLGNTQPNTLWKIIATNQDLVTQSKRISNLDIVHSSSWSAIPALRIITRRHNIPFVFDCRTSLFNVNKSYNIYKWIVLRFFCPDRVIFVENRSMTQYLKTYRRQNCSIIPVPIDVESFKPAIPVSTCSNLTVLFASSLRPEKGLLDLYKAMKEVWQIRPDAKLLVAGNGPLRSDVEMWQQNHQQVQYLGPVPNEKMPEVYARTDILVYPSYFEGFPRTVLEALACGVPVIATDVGGLHLLRDKDIGIVLQPGDHIALKEAILNLASNPSRYEKYARVGREYVTRRHCWDEVIQQILGLYKSLTVTLTQAVP